MRRANSECVCGCVCAPRVVDGSVCVWVCLRTASSRWKCVCGCVCAPRVVDGSVCLYLSFSQQFTIDCACQHVKKCFLLTYFWWYVAWFVNTIPPKNGQKSTPQIDPQINPLGIKKCNFPMRKAYSFWKRCFFGRVDLGVDFRTPKSNIN